MADPKWEKEQLENFKKRLENCMRFECACCYEGKAVPDDVGEVRLYKAKSRMIKNQIENKAAPYVVCSKCLRDVAPDIRDRRVLERLASAGLFG